MNQKQRMARWSATRRAILDAGGDKAVSDAFGISIQAVYSWRERGCVPPARLAVPHPAVSSTT